MKSLRAILSPVLPVRMDIVELMLRCLSDSELFRARLSPVLLVKVGNSWGQGPLFLPADFSSSVT